MVSATPSGLRMLMSLKVSVPGRDRFVKLDMMVFFLVATTAVLSEHVLGVWLT